jgi:hypothetical protein
MPRDKDLKRLVRARMTKTGEAYTAARANVINKPKAKVEAAPAPRPDYAALAGKSDAVIKQNTGCDWEKWVYVLDRKKAADLTHGEIARIVNEQYKIDGWWAQTVAVGYERIKGLRVIGQRRDGTYEASKSRTYNVPVETLFDAWADASKRKKWLKARVKVRTSNPPKTLRLGWDDGTIIAVGFTPKGDSKSQVAIQVPKLRSKVDAEHVKQQWSEYMDALGKVLA